MRGWHFLLFFTSMSSWLEEQDFEACVICASVWTCLFRMKLLFWSFYWSDESCNHKFVFRIHLWASETIERRTYNDFDWKFYGRLRSVQPFSICFYQDIATLSFHKCRHTISSANLCFCFQQVFCFTGCWGEEWISPYLRDIF